MTSRPHVGMAAMLLAQVALILCSGVRLVGAERIANEIVIVVDPPAQRPASVVATASPSDSTSDHDRAGPATSSDFYREIFTSPMQVYVHTDAGPMPLFTDLVYDNAGKPHLRLPDPFTYDQIVDPSPDHAAAVVAQRNAVLRRFNESQAYLIPAAERLGIMDSSVLQVPESRRPDALAVGSMESIEASSRGTPALTDAQARASGLEPAEIPVTPGDPRTIEVLWFWSMSCPFTEQAVGDWATFARDVNAAGYKAMGICLDQDTGAIAARLSYWELKGHPTLSSPNRQDVTDLRHTLHIAYTPTYVFINRETGVIKRREEVTSEAQLRAEFVAIAGLPAGQWPPPAAKTPGPYVDHPSASVAPATVESAAGRKATPLAKDTRP